MDEERVPVSQIKANPDQMADAQVTRWIGEVLTGQRGYETTVVVEDVRPNPFATNLNDQAVNVMAGEIRRLERQPHLMLARLPGGGFVDVDTPHECEAVRRAGVNLVDATIIGTFTEADCERIGLRV